MCTSAFWEDCQVLFLTLKRWVYAPGKLLDYVLGCIYIFIGTYSVCRGVKAQDVGWSWWILTGHRFWMNNQVSDSHIVKTLFVWWQFFFSKLSLFSLKDTPSCLSFWRLKILSAFLYNLYFAMYVTFKEIILQMYIVFSITTVICHNESKYVSWREGSSCVCEVLKSLCLNCEVPS